ncbi:hypothetical protein ACFX13_035647 [Malus domestica]
MSRNPISSKLPSRRSSPDDDRLEETPGPRAAPPEPPPRRRPHQISVYAAEAQIHQPLPVQIPGATQLSLSFLIPSSISFLILVDLRLFGLHKDHRLFMTEDLGNARPPKVELEARD